MNRLPIDKRIQMRWSDSRMHVDTLYFAGGRRVDQHRDKAA